ncbi:MAG TPA: FtsX-like permease family protein [Candidatus Wolfebacteria bacterium]|nr:FtsX-like permease family protein [Candidatus Wolfebacteria bacterium]
MDPQKLQEPKYFISESKGHHLRMGDLFRLSLRVFRIRPLRTFLTIFGISLGIGTVLFLVSLGYGLQYVLIGKLATTEDSLISLEAFYPIESGLSISSDDINSIIDLEESEEISPVSEFAGEVTTDSFSGFLLMKIIKPNYFRLSGLKPDIGSVFTEEEESVVISNTALKLLDLKEDESSLGKKLSLKIFYQNEEEIDVKIAEVSSDIGIRGIVIDEFQPPFIFIPFDSVIDKPPSYQRVLVKAKDIDSVELLKDKLIEKGFLISARLDLVNQAKKIMNIITVILGIFGVAALVVSSIGMFNTMIIGFLERVFEVGIMKSIGASAKDIRNLFLMESLIMGLFGGIGGILIGISAGEIFNFGLNFLAKYLGGKPVDLFIYPFQFLIFIIIASGVVGILSGFWPARRAAKLSPRQAFIRK